MKINGEDVYLYSPFDIKRWSEEELESETSLLIKKYNPNADTMYELALNIEILANMNYLFGEMIARLTTEFELSKLDVDTTEDKAVYRLRNAWIGEGKTPSIDFFKAQASELVKEERARTYKKLEMLNRFKRAYSAFEEKINAIKKKMESIKYEEFGGTNGL